jgi:hypothetical protein
VEVSPYLIESTPEMAIDLPSGRRPCSSGKQFGSKFPGNPSTVTVYDIIPSEHLSHVNNIDDFLGILALDKWVCQTDKRQAIFKRQYDSDFESVSNKTYQALMIDQGNCFDGGNWGFPDAPLHGLYFNRLVYHSVVGMESFEPWLGRLENELSLGALYAEASKVPTEWYCDDSDALKRLVDRLYIRRTRVRELIWSARNALPELFPNWKSFISPKSITTVIPMTGIGNGHHHPPAQLKCTNPKRKKPLKGLLNRGAGSSRRETGRATRLANVAAQK